MTATIDLEKKNHVARLTINNPPANTWTKDSLGQLEKIIHELNEDTSIYALVITGSGEKFFSAGADLKSFSDGDIDNSWMMAKAFGDAFEALSQFSGVSVAAINGYAMGGGLEVALACDIRIAEEQVQLALPEAGVGLLPCAGGTQNLAWLVGEGWAKRMILCGERVSAEKAEKIGLIEEMVGKGEALQTAIDLAEKVQAQSPTAVRACKKLIQAGRHGPVFDALPKEREAFLKLFDDDNTLEGVNAFLEKRTPEWK